MPGRVSSVANVVENLYLLQEDNGEEEKDDQKEGAAK